MKPRMSVIVPTFRRAEMACRCVRSVLASDLGELEVIVVDDCSPDDTSERLKAEFGSDPRFRCERNPRNLQLGASRNRGATFAKGDLLLFLDDDNLVEPEMAGRIAADFEAHPEAGLIAPVAVHVHGRKDGRVWTLGSDFNCWTSQPRDHLANIPEGEIPPGVERFPTLYSPNAFAVPRAVHERVGGFCEELPFYFDESDYAWRIRDLGFKAWILASAVTRHQNFTSADDSPELRDLGINATWRAFLLGRNRLRFARRHFSLLQALAVTLAFAPLSAAYYCSKALANRRPDIAWAYLRGTLLGMVGA